MVDAALELHAGGEQIRSTTRQLAKEKYGLDAMVDAYVSVLSGDGRHSSW
jgi:hypothetical protein